MLDQICDIGTIVLTGVRALLPPVLTFLRRLYKLQWFCGDFILPLEAITRSPAPSIFGRRRCRPEAAVKLAMILRSFEPG